MGEGVRGKQTKERMNVDIDKRKSVEGKWKKEKYRRKERKCR